MATIATRPDPTFLQIIKDLRDDLTALFRQEVALAKSEVKEKAEAYAKNTALLAVAAVTGICALFFALSALSHLILAGLAAAGLSLLLSAWLAPLILGAILGAGALVLAKHALNTLRHENPVPEKTLESLREDKAWLAEKAKG